MDNLSDILLRKDFDVPPEVAIITRYVDEHFHVPVTVRVQEKVIVVTGKSSSLIGSLRMHVHQLQKACQTDKKIVLRVG